MGLGFEVGGKQKMDITLDELRIISGREKFGMPIIDCTG